LILLEITLQKTPITVLQGVLQALWLVENPPYTFDGEATSRKFVPFG
jgi:hypothetical protein